jgi:hypothetical protein
MFLIITDGEISAIDSTIESAKKKTEIKFLKSIKSKPYTMPIMYSESRKASKKGSVHFIKAHFAHRKNRPISG